MGGIFVSVEALTKHIPSPAVSLLLGQFLDFLQLNPGFYHPKAQKKTDLVFEKRTMAEKNDWNQPLAEWLKSTSPRNGSEPRIDHESHSKSASLQRPSVALPGVWRSLVDAAPNSESDETNF